MKIVLFLLLIFLGTACAQSNIILKTTAQESYPKYYMDKNGKMAGLCVDILQAVDEILPDVEIAGYGEFTPFKRLQILLNENQLDLFFGFKKNDKRLKLYHFLDHPLYTLNYTVAVKKDDVITIRNFDDIRHLSSNAIITPLGSATERFLNKEENLTILTPYTIIDAFKMANWERGRFVFYHDLGLHSIINTHEIAKDFKVLPVTFHHYSHYVAFSKNIPGTVVYKIEKALKTLEKNGTLDQIRKKYFNSY